MTPRDEQFHPPAQVLRGGPSRHHSFDRPPIDLSRADRQYPGVGCEAGRAFLTHLRGFSQNCSSTAVLAKLLSRIVGLQPRFPLKASICVTLLLKQMDVALRGVKKKGMTRKNLSPVGPMVNAGTRLEMTSHLTKHHIRRLSREMVNVQLVDMEMCACRPCSDAFSCYCRCYPLPVAGDSVSGRGILIGSTCPRVTERKSFLPSPNPGSSPGHGTRSTASKNGLSNDRKTFKRLGKSGICDVTNTCCC